MNRTSLTALLDQHLNLARKAPSGRSAHTVYGGNRRTLRQTFIVLIAGHQLDEHENPGEATLQVMRGRVRLISGEKVDEGGPGDLLTIPDSRHRLEALEDAGLLLTVAKLP